MGWSTTIRQQRMDAIAALDISMALFSADPMGVSSPATVEVVGQTYARQDSVWTRTGPTTLTLAQPCIWRSLPPGAVVAAVGAFDDPFQGVLLFADLLTPQAEFPSGGTYVLPAGEYVLRT